MADNSIFSSDDGFNSSKRNRENDDKKDGFLNRNLQKFGSSLRDLADDTIDSIESEARGTFNSFKDRFLPKSLRQNEDDGEFIINEVSIANRHRDAITGILTDTFDGNLFDAGVDTLNLINFGTKWKTVFDTYTDKDSYPFRYNYFSIDDDVFRLDLEGSETGDTGILQLLESIEDPTVLGFAVKINYVNSPLFKGVGAQLDLEATETDDDFFADSSINSALDFIARYSPQHREMVMCREYLEEFTEGIKQIFESPETVDNSGRRYNDGGYRNHYIQEIDGLDKLDNHFVEYNEDVKDQESLEIVLGEDVRMFTNRLAFLYRNLTWSYNMGKKLIPENKLRFDMYIKMSDMRSFTSIANKKIARDMYSRVIYELKDCEFLFNESLNPKNLKMAGFGGVNEDYANLQMKIKYRKVNRIFYSKMFGNDNGGVDDMFIGDKFYEPENENKTYAQNYAEELLSWGFSPQSTEKREDKNNNIPITISLDERLSRLQNQGLFRGEDNDDTALNRFVKGIGNEAVKAGAQFVDEGLQKIRNNVEEGINNKLEGKFNNNFTSSIRDFIDGNVEKKTTELGDLHPPVNSPVVEPNNDLHPDVNENIEAPNNDLHPTTGFEYVSPSADLHPTTEFEYEQPDEDLHPTIDEPIVSPDEDLHPDTDFEYEQPVEDLHPDLDEPIESPEEDLHPDLDEPIQAPEEDLHPDLDEPIEAPEEDLHPEVDEGIGQPEEDLHPTIDEPIESPEEDLHPEVNENIEAPNNDLHPESDKTVGSPEEDLHPEVDGTVSIEDKNLHPDSNNDVENPDETRDSSFLRFIRKDPPPNSRLDDC